MMAAEFPASNYSPVPWEEQSPEAVWTRSTLLLHHLQHLVPHTAAAQLLTQHSDCSAICSIYFSNQIEDVGLPLAATALLVKAVLQGKTTAELTPAASGDANRKAHLEVLQHAAAFVFLRDAVVLRQQPLTEAVICEAHSILMAGAVREDGLVVQAGCYRQGSAAAGSHSFPPAHCIPASMAELLLSHGSRTADPFAAAARLSYAFVALHPFEDGNGRLSRLLLNASLLSRRVPLCSALGFSPGPHRRRRAKQHYFQCLRDADRRGGGGGGGGGPGKLAFVVLCDFVDAAAALFEALRGAAPDEYPQGLRERLEGCGAGPGSGPCV